MATETEVKYYHSKLWNQVLQPVKVAFFEALGLHQSEVVMPVQNPTSLLNDLISVLIKNSNCL